MNAEEYAQEIKELKEKEAELNAEYLKTALPVETEVIYKGKLYFIDQVRLNKYQAVHLGKINPFIYTLTSIGHEKDNYQIGKYRILNADRSDFELANG